MFLAADLAEVTSSWLLGEIEAEWRRRLQPFYSREVIDQRRQGVDGHHLQPFDQGRFGRVRRRNEDLTKAALRGEGRHWQDAGHVAHRPVEGQLADNQRAVEPLRPELAGGRQRPDGDRQVVGRPFLTQ